MYEKTARTQKKRPRECTQNNAEAETEVRDRKLDKHAFRKVGNVEQTEHVGRKKRKSRFYNVSPHSWLIFLALDHVTRCAFTSDTRVLGQYELCYFRRVGAKIEWEFYDP